MREHLGFFVVAFSAVFFVVDPLALIPMFLAITEHETAAERARTVLRATLTCCLTLTVFAVAGGLIFRLFSISLPAFKIAGGILLFLVALEMMQAQRERTRPEENKEGIEKRDVAIIPLAIPLLSGPGAIATVMVLMTRHSPWHFGIPVVVAIVLTSVLTYALLRGASYLQRHLSRTFMNVVSRIMGLILAAIAVEFVLGGLREALPRLATSS
jgi:multiple antibiotic resistance protein